MLHTIYFGPKKLLIASALPQQPNMTDPSQAFIQEVKDSTNIGAAVQKLVKENFYIGILLSADPEATLEAVKSSFTFVPAAGGLVLNKEGKILLIYRHNKWDLPKGKLDPGEDLPTCAVREVMEETGISEVHIVQPLSTTFHTYFMQGRHCLKASYWYLMRSEHTDALVPQTSEGIEQCIWADKEDMANYLGNTHPAIADVLHEGLALI